MGPLNHLVQCSHFINIQTEVLTTTLNLTCFSKVTFLFIMYIFLTPKIFKFLRLTDLAHVPVPYHGMSPGVHLNNSFAGTACLTEHQVTRSIEPSKSISKLTKLGSTTKKRNAVELVDSIHTLILILLKILKKLAL